MRKLGAIENVTLDGVADSQEGLGFEWTARAYDREVDRYSNEHVRADVDMAMYGRATYLGMQGFWSNMLDSADGTPAERAHAEWVNNVDKVVFSTTLEAADWANSRLIGDGTPLFHDKAKLDLELLESKMFDSGAVYLRYQVGNAAVR